MRMIRGMRILLLSGEGVQVVSLAKHLVKIGCKVDALCAYRISSGYATRWLSKRYIAPSIENDEAGYLKKLVELISINKYNLIIPTADESASFLSRHKSKIEAMYDISCAIEDWDKYKTASCKGNLMRLCDEIGADHPKTVPISMKSVSDAVKIVGFPALIKPDFSAGARGIARVNNIRELQVVLPAILKEYGECTLQQYIEQPSHYYNVMLYRDAKGKYTGYTVIKIRRYFPLRGGTSCYAETVFNDKLITQCKQVMDALQWRGFADFDVLEDVITGAFKIIEINPRVPSSLQGSFAAGVNFAECYVKDYLGGEVLPFNYKENQQIRWFGLDVLWFLMSPDRFRFSPSWFSFFGKKISYHDGSWNDPLPMIAGCVEGLIKYANPRFRKSKLKKD